MAGEELIWRETGGDELAAHVKIDALEHAMRAQLEPREIEPDHHFADGIYTRTLVIPKGTLLTGKIHRTQHVNIVSAGAITVFSVNEPPRLIVAPAIFVAEPGSRRVGLAHEDTVWTTVHKNPSNSRDLDKLETLLIEPRDEQRALADLQRYLGSISEELL